MSIGEQSLGHVHVCDMTHSYMRLLSVHRWTWVGGHKVNEKEAEYRLFYRALLQKRPIIVTSHCWMSLEWVLNESTLTHECPRVNRRAFSGTHSYVWHDSCICVTWLIHMCDMTHSYVWHDSFICVTWLIRMCDIIQVEWKGSRMSSLL